VIRILDGIEREPWALVGGGESSTSFLLAEQMERLKRVKSTAARKKYDDIRKECDDDRKQLI